MILVSQAVILLPMIRLTHVQAYNSSAKMVRSADIGSIASYLICRGYKTGDRLYRKRANEPRQYAQDVRSYCINYVRRGQCLRVEEVLTFDYLRLDEPMWDVIRRYRVFDNDERSIITTELLRRNMLYRLNNWRIYFDGSVGTNVKFFKNVILNIETLDNFTWLPPAIVRQTIRAYIRIMYFTHGNSPQYNYDVINNVFMYRTEAESNRNGVVRLRPLSDETDIYLYPLFSKAIRADEMNVLRHLWTIGTAIWNLYAQDEDDEQQSLIKYLVCSYGSYTFLKPNVIMLEANVVQIAQNVYNNFQQTFTIQSFIQRFRKTWRKRYVRVSGYISAKDVVRAIMDAPATMFAKTCRASIRFDCNGREAFKKFVEDKVEIFPTYLIRNKQINQLVWSIVKTKDVCTTTVQNVHKMMVRGATFHVPPKGRQSRKTSLPPTGATYVDAICNITWIAGTTL